MPRPEAVAPLRVSGFGVDKFDKALGIVPLGGRGYRVCYDRLLERSCFGIVEM